jgi:hypothetical protein
MSRGDPGAAAVTSWAGGVLAATFGLAAGGASLGASSLPGDTQPTVNAMMRAEEWRTAVRSKLRMDTPCRAHSLGRFLHQSKRLAIFRRTINATQLRHFAQLAFFAAIKPFVRVGTVLA